ncbi:hypothetical protein DFQ27_001015 [Actinomortierella ambigua]|uniref:Uncharacterized protein n=1 Tax=Actinomortierella ambigua TaxID=1343610 RepID=A0A9P6QFJ7_9FUNG|nr:hypothetical protein DFQ27_001015 [Actinomortierella ambigua]
MCIAIEALGPYTRRPEDEPEHLLKYLAKMKALRTKSLPFHHSIEAAIQARLRSGQWPVNELPATILTPRSLKPVEKTDKQGNVLQGYTWRSDPILTFHIPTSASNAYGEAFMRRITCPFLAFFTTHGFRTRFDVDERLSWLTNAQVVTTHTVEGSHHIHLEDPELVAKMVSEWIIERDKTEKARL